jgi:hypothetical protein
MIEIDQRFGCAYCFHHQGDHRLKAIIALMKEEVRTSETSAIAGDDRPDDEGSKHF